MTLNRNPRNYFAETEQVMVGVPQHHSLICHQLLM
jgi:catalase